MNTARMYLHMIAMMSPAYSQATTRPLCAHYVPSMCPLCALYAPCMRPLISTLVPKPKRDTAAPPRRTSQCLHATSPLPPPPPETMWAQAPHAFYPPLRHVASADPRKSTWIMGKITDGVLDLQVPDIDFAL